VRRDPGVEDEQAGTVLADHVLRERLVGGIGGDGCEALAEFVAYRAQRQIAIQNAFALLLLFDEERTSYRQISGEEDDRDVRAR
jgi:hypothetical protein